MTDNEIINNIIWCMNPNNACADCPYYELRSSLDCVSSLFRDTLDLINRQKEKYDHLLKVACKMHTWIFLNTGDEQAAYDEIGLSDEDNAMLGYGGEFKIIVKNDNLLKEMVGEDK